MNRAHDGMTARGNLVDMTDADLREKLLGSIKHASASSTAALESRVMAQWNLRSVGPLDTPPVGVLTLQGRPIGARVLAVTALVVGLFLCWMQMQQDDDWMDLMQPDVLSIVSFDEF